VRVGLVCPYSLDVPGGVQNHVRDLAAELARRGYEVGVLAPGESAIVQPTYVELVGKAVPVPYNGSVARLAFGPRVAARTGRWLAEGGFDVVHLHEPLIPSVSLLALWAAEQPVVATFHVAGPRSRAMTSVSALLRPSVDKIAARIAVSEEARTTSVRHVGKEPVVIPNGLSCRVFANGAPFDLDTGAGPTPVLSFLGRLDEPRKGLGVLAAAIPTLLAAEPRLRVLVAGRGNPRVLESLAPDVRRAVHVLGQVPDQDRARLFASSNVFVAPHTGGESFGMVVVEAMASGTPVVASDLPAFSAVLGRGAFGRMFTAGDPAGCAATVLDVLRDPVAARDMAQRAMTAVRRYDWSHVTDEITAVYDAVLPSTGWPHR